MSEITIRYDGAINSWTVEVDGLGVVFHATDRADVALFAAKLMLYEQRLRASEAEQRIELAKAHERIGMLDHCLRNVSAILVAAGAPNFDSPYSAQRWADGVRDLRRLAEQAVEYGLMGADCFAATRAVEAKQFREALEALRPRAT